MEVSITRGYIGARPCCIKNSQNDSSQRMFSPLTPDGSDFAMAGGSPRVVRGCMIHESFLDETEQGRILSDIREVEAAAPPYSPVTPSGRRMSVRMTSAGDLGWVADRKGYRYQPRHPSGMRWPPIPASVLEVWRRTAGCRRLPDSLLVNFYGETAKMGMHRDSDEADLSWPVVSISMGDDALFRIGNEERGGRTDSVWLRSGDVLVMDGPARLLHHGVDRIRFGSSTLLANGGRLNLTLRVAG